MAGQDAKAATPKLRFPKFKGSDAWSTERMDRLYSFGRNNLLSRDKLNYVAGTVKNIHYGDIHTKFPATFDVSREQVPFINQNESVPAFASGDYCIEGDLVFADASEDMNDVGKTMEIVRLHGEQVLAGQHTILARQRGAAFVTGFGAYLFGSGLMRDRIKKEAQGTKVYQISAARLGGIDVTYPCDKAEQQKIADCLTSLDEVIAAQDRKVQALKAHKRGLMQQLFPREGETRPRLRFPEFRDAPEWESLRFFDLIDDVLDFRGRTPTKLGMTWGGGDIISLSANNVKNGFIDYGAECNLASEELHSRWMAGTNLEKGDIVFTMEAPLGQALMIPDDRKYVLSQRVVAFKTKRHVANDFLLQLIWSDVFQSAIGLLATGSTAKGVSQKSLQGLVVSLPKKVEQQRIAGCLASLDTQITAEAHQLVALKTHKQGLMQQLFPAPEAAGA